MINSTGIISSQWDKSALDFISAVGLTTQSHRLAIQYLVQQLKIKGLWTKMKVIYPFIGGTATTHRYNLKDPQLTTGAFAITFTGTWTHNANGIAGNGTNNLADTNFNPRTHLTNSTSVSHGCYIRATASSGMLGGANNSALGSAQHYLYITTNGTSTFTGTLDSESVSVFTITPSTYAGFVCMNRTSATNIRAYHNGTKLLDTTNALTNSPNFNYYIGSRNNAGTAANYSTANIAFYYIGDTLTDTDASNMYSIIQQYQTILTRQI